MRLNHLDLAVPDVGEARDFFCRYLGFVQERTLGQDGLSILRDESDMVLVLSRLQRRGAQDYPAGFHIGFHLDDEAAVSVLHARIVGEAGLAAAVPTMQRGAFSFYFTAPGGVLVEVAAR